VSCSIDGQGVATVLDPGSRRRFVLAPGASPQPNAAAVAQPQPQGPPQVLPPHPSPRRIEPPVLANPAPAANHHEASAPQPARAKRFETVGFAPEHLVERPAVAAPAKPAAPLAPEVVAVVEPAPVIEPAPRKKKKFETVAFAPVMEGAAAGALDPTPRDQPAVMPNVRVADSGPVGGHRASVIPGRRTAELELLFDRNEEPTEGNPLFYCERAYLLPRGISIADAEAALRWKLADMQRELEARRRGKLVNLAVFDHRWHDVPERPPVITLQWRDWRSEVVVDYPAAARHSSAPPAPSSPPSGGHDDRLADVFEALGALGRLTSAADALDFAVKLIERTVPCEAVAACLYDINTDELRFVALTGTGAAELQGRAVSRASGLFGPAARLEHHASVFKDVFVEPAFDPEIDSRPGLDARTIVLRPIVHEHQLLGMLQLINRTGRLEFTSEDAHLVSYIAERLSEFINAARRHRSQQPPAR
jgi:hypothetical protein